MAGCGVHCDAFMVSKLGHRVPAGSQQHDFIQLKLVMEYFSESWEHLSPETLFSFSCSPHEEMFPIYLQQTEICSHVYFFPPLFAAVFECFIWENFSSSEFVLVMMSLDF